MINSLHVQCLEIIYNDKYSTFEELLEKGNFVTIQKRSFHFVAIEVFKFVKGIYSTILKDIFHRNEGNNSNLEKSSDFSLQCLVDWKLYHI